MATDNFFKSTITIEQETLKVVVEELSTNKKLTCTKHIPDERLRNICDSLAALAFEELDYGSYGESMDEDGITLETIESILNEVYHQSKK